MGGNSPTNAYQSLAPLHLEVLGDTQILVEPSTHAQLHNWRHSPSHNKHTNPHLYLVTCPPVVIGRGGEGRRRARARVWRVESELSPGQNPGQGVARSQRPKNKDRGESTE